MSQPDQTAQSLTLSVEQVAKALGVSRDAAYQAIRAGELPSIRLGRRILVPRAALDRLLNGAEPGMADR